MDSASVGNNIDAILLDRYPEISFLLNFTPYEPYSIYPEQIEAEIERFLNARDLAEVEVLYLYGIGLGHHYAALKEWLAEKNSRLLIILEEDLGALAACFAFEYGEEILEHPQVHLRFLPSARQIPELLKELIATFPSEHIELAATESYAKKNKRKLQKMQMNLYRFTAVSHAFMTEALYAHKLLGNLLSNILRWPGSFFANGLKGQFKGVPAIICGAGPSLGKTFEQLKTVGDRALIIAGGSTISALSNQGIIPHLGLALDPNHEEFGRLKASSSYEMPLLYATRLESKVFNTCNGARGYLLSQTGGPCETYFEKAMDITGDPVGPELGPEAFSVTTIAIALAVEMGCDPIILNGIDLAYTGMQRYAEGVMPTSKVFVDEIKAMKKAGERLLKKKDIHGNPAHTLVKWVMESECIAEYAKHHPECRFINASAGGLGFPGIPNRSFAELLQEQPRAPFDLNASLHIAFEKLKMPLERESILQEMQKVYESLVRLESIADQMLQELEKIKLDPTLQLPSGKTTILEIDFQEEIAFECHFPHLGPALDRLLNRIYYLSPMLSEDEKRTKKIERQIAKWAQWKQMIQSEKNLMKDRC